MAESVLLLFAFASIAASVPVMSWAQTEQPDQNGLTRYFLTVDGKEFSLRYLIEGDARILNMSANQESKSLVILLDSDHGDGKLQIGLWRELIEAKDENNNDIGYSVFVDGRAADHTELDKTDFERLIEVPFESGEREIVITGTYIVPEFSTLLGPIALAIGLTGGIFYLSRLRMGQHD